MTSSSMSRVDLGSLAAVRVEATDEQVARVMFAPENEDGRSPFYFIRFPNGDLVLATYPAGETYMGLTDVVGV